MWSISKLIGAKMRTAQCFYKKIKIHEDGSEYMMWGKIVKIKKRGQLAIVRGVHNCIMHTQVFNIFQGPEL